MTTSTEIKMTELKTKVIKGYIEVTKDEFFAIVGKMDTISDNQKNFSVWMLRNRNIVGKTFPGYLCEDDNGKYTDTKRYYLVTHKIIRNKLETCSGRSGC